MLVFEFENLALIDSRSSPEVARIGCAWRSDSPLSEAPRGIESILIVDDESALARVAKRVLDDAGYTTCVATSGTEALRMAEAMTGRLHLLFTDVVMPEMRGTELARRITALHPEIVVLDTSEYYDDDILRDAIQDRSAMLLAKPYVPLKLRRKVREILDVKQKRVN